MARILLYFALALSVACSAPGGRRASVGETELLSGAALGLVPPLEPAVSPLAAVALDDTMRAFVASHTGDVKHPELRLNALLAGMKEKDLFSIDYSNAVTGTVRESFYEHKGNCLSFTMLFVALAREAGLDVSYQIVDVPPTWSNETGLVVVSNHISALVDTPGATDLVVDFNSTGFGREHERRALDDAQVLAFFYTNLGAESLLREEHEESFRYLRAAIESDPGIVDAWINLGVLYRRLDHAVYAESAYLRALAMSPGNRSALSNLATLHAELGNRELAAEYQQRIRHYQQRNPYYHYAIAENAYREARYEDALAAVARAVRLKRDEHGFYFLQGLSHLELGQQAEADESFERATLYRRGEVQRAANR